MTDNDLEVATDVVRDKPWRQVDCVRAASPYLALLSLLLASSALLGYLFETPWLFRPLISGPATHPLTLICLLLAAGSALFVVLPKVGKWVTALVVPVILLILLVRLSDLLFSAELAPYITPFQDVVNETVARGESNSLGLNSILMLFGIVTAQILLKQGHLGFAQAAAFAATFIPAVSLVGYLYKLEGFHGEMSQLTTASGMLLALCMMCQTAHIGVIRAVLSPYSYGWIFRIQCLAGVLVTASLGFAITKLVNAPDHSAFGIYVVANIWFMLMLGGVSAFFQERVDAERRESEQLLLEAATLDQLTHLCNRRKFFEYGRHEIQRLERAGQGLWLLMLDLDHFKSINDTVGHDMGDKVLVMVSRGMQKCVRNIDLVSRLGGEEFAILLPDSSREGAERVARCILEAVRSAFIFGWTDIHGPVTVSIGGAEITRGVSLEEGLKEADQALYEAKRQGRNQVVFVPQWPAKTKEGLG